MQMLQSVLKTDGEPKALRCRLTCSGLSQMVLEFFMACVLLCTHGGHTE